MSLRRNASDHSNRKAPSTVKSAEGEQLEQRLCLAATPQFLGDINTESQQIQTSTFVAAEDFVYYSRDDALHGRELWRTDGTAEGTLLVKDINPGPDGSASNNNRGFFRRGYPSPPHQLTLLENNVVIFVADDGTHGAELWRSDGTEKGTFLLRDNSESNYSGPSSLYKFGSHVFFASDASGTGRELWRTDGSTEGTVLVKDIYPGNEGSFPSYFQELNGQLIFVARDGQHGRELWTTDGTGSGTTLIKDLTGEQFGYRGGVNSYCGHQQCDMPPTKHEQLNLIFFVGTEEGNRGLWVSDGTSDGTQLISDAEPDFRGNVRVTENKLFYFSRNGQTRDVWVSDGTRAGTLKFSGIPASAYLSRMQPSGDDIIFSVEGRNDDTSSLWIADSDRQVVRQLEARSDINFYRQPMGEVGETAFFVWTDGRSVRPHELWRANAEGAHRVWEIDVDTGDFQGWGTNFGDQLIISANNRLWATDEAAENIVLLHDGARFVGSFQWRDEMLLASSDGALWLTDGTIDGTRQITSGIQPTGDSHPHPFVAFQGKAYFLAQVESRWQLHSHDPTTGERKLIKKFTTWYQADSLQIVQDRLVIFGSGEVWSSDGTTEGTTRLTSISGADDLQVLGDKIYTIDQKGLWESDGTTAGTKLVHSGPQSLRNGDSMTIVGETLYFIALGVASPTNLFNTPRLWKSDGTEEGTLKLFSVPHDARDLTAVGEHLLYVSQSGLLRSDGTVEGSVWLMAGNSVSDINAAGNLAVFTADDGIHGREVWVSDGTADGTHMVADLEKRDTGSEPRQFIRVADATYFAAGGEIWKIPDAEAEPPQRVVSVPGNLGEMTNFQDKLLFAGDFSPLHIVENDGEFVRLGGVGVNQLTVVDDTVYFASGDYEDVSVLWVSNGTVEGTRPVMEDGPTRPTDLTRVGSTVYLVATSDTGKRELWRTNGSGGPLVRLQNSNGADVTEPTNLTPFGDSLLFSAKGPDSSRELWVTDGSAGGTHPLIQIPSEATQDSLATDFVKLGGWTYFVADDGVHGREIWRTDGSIAGTEFVTDHEPGARDFDIENLIVAGDRLFFSSLANEYDQMTSLWWLDASSKFATPVGLDELMNPRDMVVLNGSLYLTAEPDYDAPRHLFRIVENDGEVVPEQLTTQGAAPQVGELTVVGNRLFFAADTPAQGRELWQSDGTKTGTSRVHDIFDAITVAAAPGQFVQVNDLVYFTATDSTHGTELWVSDGTDTHLVQDIAAGSESSDPTELTEFGGKLVFTAQQTGQTAAHIWTTDGTSQGTRPIGKSPQNVNPRNPQSLLSLGGRLLFFAETPEDGWELWKLNDQGVGSTLIKSIQQGTGSAILPSEPMVVVGGLAYFAADDGVNGRELWQTDGTTDGTKLVADLRPGPLGSISTDVASHKLVPDGDRLFFAADSDGRLGAEIWVTSGNPADTILVHDPRMTTNQSTLPLDVVNGWLYFAGPSADAGTELWRTDGSASNTMLVADISPGPGSSIFFPHGEVTPVGNGRAVFPVITNQLGRELWSTDGTTQGTFSLDLEPGPGAATLGPLVQVRRVGTQVYFFASTPSRGSGLWKSDGTVGGTELVVTAPLEPWPDLTLLDGSLYFGSTGEAGSLAKLENGELGYIPLQSSVSNASSTPTDLTAVGELVYFSADDGLHGRELWRSDGTAAGTELVVDLLPGRDSSAPNQFAASGENMLIAAYGAESNRGLWSLSASGSATRLQPSGELGNAAGFVPWDGQVAFMAEMENGIRHLWMSDGTSAGTRKLGGATPRFGNPQQAVVMNEHLFVVADSSGVSSLWRFETGNDSPAQLTTAEVVAPVHVLGDELYFTAAHPELGLEPWVSDGTVDGTRLVADVNQAKFGSNPSPPTMHDGEVYAIVDVESGQELWVSDGSADSSRAVPLAALGVEGEPTAMVSSGNNLYLTIATSAGHELWNVDAKNEAAVLLWSDSDDQRFQKTLDVLDDQLFFLASTDATGTELWMTDGTSEGTRLVSDISPGVSSSQIDQLIRFGSGFVFSASEPTAGQELWFSDGTADGTYRIADVRAGSAGSSVREIHVAANRIYFSANDGVHGTEPWISDGTTAGTRMLHNVDTTTLSSIGEADYRFNFSTQQPGSWLTVVGPDVFFIASVDGKSDIWRWSTLDPLAAPEPLRISGSSHTDLVASASGVLYFSAYHPESGQELWISDGTSEGTRLLSEIVPGRDGSSPETITPFADGSIYFSAVDEVHGREAWWLPSRPGDTDGDRDIDFADFLKFAAAFGTVGVGEAGDLNGDGTVGFADFLILRDSFGAEE